MNSSNLGLQPGVTKAEKERALALNNWGLKFPYHKNSKFHGLSLKLLKDII
jgi:hypothetical protein